MRRRQKVLTVSAGVLAAAAATWAWTTADLRTRLSGDVIPIGGDLVAEQSAETEATTAPPNDEAALGAARQRHVERTSSVAPSGRVASGAGMAWTGFSGAGASRTSDGV